MDSADVKAAEPAINVIAVSPVAAAETEAPAFRSVSSHPDDRDRDRDRHNADGAHAVAADAADGSGSGRGSGSGAAGSTSEYRTLWVAFWVLGTINNFSYVIVQSAAQSLAEQFDAEHLLGLIQWANVGFGTVVRGINAVYLLGVSYYSRVLANAVALFVGLGLLSLSVWVSFGFAIFAIVIIGSASSFGESVILGWLKEFNPLLVGAWSSGTGMAGVGGTLIYLLLFSVIGMSNQLVFLLLAPTAIIYWVAYRIVTRNHTHAQPPTAIAVAASDSPVAALRDSAADGSEAPEAPDVAYRAIDGTKSKGSPVARSGGGEQGVSSDEQQLLGVNEPPLRRYARVAGAVGNVGGQLALVYFLEYVASVGFANKANPTAKDHPELQLNWWQRNAYPLLSFCYQFGVLLSRSSISVLKVRRVWILTALQAANFVLWCIHALHNFLPLWLQFVAMIYVGLLGGLMYVNVFYLLTTSDVVPPRDVELAINIVAIYVNGGIVAAAIFELIAAATFLK